MVSKILNNHQIQDHDSLKRSATSRIGVKVNVYIPLRFRRINNLYFRYTILSGRSIDAPSAPPPQILVTILQKARPGTMEHFRELGECPMVVLVLDNGLDVLSHKYLHSQS